MKKEILSSKQAVAILYSYILGSTVITGMNSKAGQDTWVSMLIAIFAALLIYFMYARICKLYPGLDLFDIVEKLFGKFLGKLFIFLFAWYGLHLGSLVISNFGQFIHTAALTETPLLPIYLLMGFMAIYAVKSGIETFGKSAVIFMPILAVVVLFTFFASMKDFHLSNLQPILYKNWPNVFSSAFSGFTFPFAEAVLFLAVADSIGQKDSLYKIFTWGLITGGFILWIALLRNIMVLGFPLMSEYFFPSFTEARTIIIGKGNALARFEQLITGNFFVAGYVKTSISLFAASKGFAKLFGIKDYRKIVIPTGLLMVALTSILYKNVMEMFEWIDVYKYYALPFQVLLPLVIWITAEIKSKKGKPAPALPQ